jgi:hypothetical protein
MMADEQEPPAFMSALVTEHFVQSAASTTVSESSSRVAIYLSSLSSGLVALGFASSSHRALAALAFTVLPTIFILGCFTIVRLVETSVLNIVSQRRIEVIRRYYASLTPTATLYFQSDDSAAGHHGVRYSRWSFLFTMASMVIVVNSVLGGAIVALICALGITLPLGVGVTVGIAAGLLLLGASLRLEHRRVSPLVLSSAPGPAGQLGDTGRN